ncbi:F0F1 ATP synthase subunit delta [Immundisolibacter sp.]|uniref:F0F1 ATP synthase subunit delta n=1 Tax=Immundisolibacter sp. TaxID=1934948 RepID=UPI002638E136|nr:F0F1 ATP synthase subunit delta [Immundisolibacter sp.]MDD3650089.1 F0F1 ATP synthase subunit delta [Immundisolibacter sp.]
MHFFTHCEAGMDFDWLTFGFEIVNFLALVWLLHRLLYRPVLGIIAARRADIEASLAKAAAMQAEAEQRRAEYDRRLQDWASERAKARRDLDEELERERQRRLQELETELAERRQREAALREREAAELRRSAEREALALAGRFAARLLGVAAGPELQARLVRLLVERLGALPAERRAALREALRTASAPLQVTCAHPLDDTQRAELARALAALAGDRTPAIDYHQDPALLAGVRLQVGAWQLGANLQDELQAFCELVHADG